MRGRVPGADHRADGRGDGIVLKPLTGRPHGLGPQIVPVEASNNRSPVPVDWRSCSVASHSLRDGPVLLRGYQRDLETPHTILVADSTPVGVIGIVGAGTAGLFAANVLVRAGIDCEIFERLDEGSVRARARAGLIEDRTARLLAAHGLAMGCSSEERAWELVSSGAAGRGTSSITAG